MRKDVGGGGGGGAQAATATAAAAAAAAHPFSFSSCLDLKPFIATLVVVTLLIAIYQLQPYESLRLSSSSSCPIITPNTTTTTTVPGAMAKPMKLSTSTNMTSSSNSSTQKKQQQHNNNINKRTFTPYGSAAALFVQMGAYRGGPNTFSVIGLASKPIHVYGKPWFKCEYQPKTPNAPPVRVKASKILPDWGYGRVYTVVVVNCTFPSNPNPDNAGGALLLYAYYSPNPRGRGFEKFLALEEAPNSYDESHFRPPFKYDYLYCGSSLYGSLSAQRIREWIAYHAHLFGPRSHFVFHDAGGVGGDVRAVLEPWLRAGRATVQDIRDQDRYDGYYYNQFLVVNDCLHRYRHSANWTFYFDVDEYIYLPAGDSLHAVLGDLQEYTQFTIEQNPMSSRLCVLDDRHKKEADYATEWGFEKLLFRNSITGIRRDRKYAIQARNAFATGVHMSENLVGPTTHKTESKIRYYHYHNSINVLGEPCRDFVPKPARGNATWFQKVPYVYDDNMKRLAHTVKNFEDQTIGHFRVSHNFSSFVDQQQQH